MLSHSEHIKSFITVFAVLLMLSGNHPARSQDLAMPERWKDSFMYVKPLYRPDTLTIRIIGDVMMHEKQISNALTAEGTYDFSSYFMFIEDEIKDADIAIANMEFTLAGQPYTGYPCFSAPDSFAAYLAECGFDVFLAANNHIFDKGTTGAERTIRKYRELSETHGIMFTGIAGDTEELLDNNPLMIRAKGISLALLNFTYGTNSGLQTLWPKTNYINETEKIRNAFSRADAKKADFTIAFPHWGTEYVLRHSARQEEEARRLVVNGADWIIGAHPHVIQDASAINGVPVVYSLGNAVSNMSAPNTQLGLMATLRIVRQPSGDMQPLPLEYTYLWCSRPGGYNDSYTVIPIKEFIGRRDSWGNPADYEKMTATYIRVKKETHIND